MFKIFLKKLIKKTGLQDKHTLLKNHNGFGNTRGKYHHLLVLEAYFGFSHQQFMLYVLFMQTFFSLTNK